MSVRPRDALEAGSRFSLRDALATPPLSSPNATAHNGGLKFTLGGMKSTASPTPPAPPSTPQPAGCKTVGPPPLALRLGATRPTQETMRLSAVVEATQQRLKVAQAKLEATEAQLARTSAALSSERQAATARVVALKGELASAHETEAQLRSQLAARPAKTAAPADAFLSSVSAVMKKDEDMLKVEKQVEEATQQIACLEEERAKLQKELREALTLRDEAAKIAAAAEAVAVQAKKEAEDAKASLKPVDVLDAPVVENDLIDFAAEVEAPAEVDTNVLAEDAPAEKVDVQFENKDEDKDKDGGCCCDAPVAEAEEKVEAVVEAGVVAAAEAPAGPKRGVVRGAALKPPPAVTLSTSFAARLSRKRMEGHTLSLLLCLDAPPDLAKCCSSIDAAGDDRTTQMVSAVVADLKSRFQVLTQRPRAVAAAAV